VSNLTATQIEQFAAVWPVETLQPPYNLFHREIETEILSCCADHDIGVLVYGPLTHSLLSGHLRPDSELHDWRRRSPRFDGDAYRHNLEVVTVWPSLRRRRWMFNKQRGDRLDPGQPRSHPRLPSGRAGQCGDSGAARPVGRKRPVRIDAIMADAVPIGVSAPGAT
jgi:hypothetical protein